VNWQQEKLAVYTTVYPGVEHYLRAWHRSLSLQSDQGFDLWIGGDGLDKSTVIAAMGAEPEAQWVFAERGATPAQVRQRAWVEMVLHYPAVFSWTSDDLLCPTRVQAARAALAEHDVTVCAMELVDDRGDSLHWEFQVSSSAVLEQRLVCSNIFGLSNTAFRTDLLKRLLPIPADCELVDWFLALNALNLDARFHFDSVCRMQYRQHVRNMARVLPPFSEEEILQATYLVCKHYTTMLGADRELKRDLRTQIEAALARVSRFQNTVKESPACLARYVGELNRLPAEHAWWTGVARPELENIWKS